MLKELLRRHQELKKRIHATRIPLSPRGQTIMRLVYFSSPLVVGFVLYQWTISIMQQNYKIDEQGRVQLTFKNSSLKPQEIQQGREQSQAMLNILKKQAAESEKSKNHNPVQYEEEDTIPHQEGADRSSLVLETLRLHHYDIVKVASSSSRDELLLRVHDKAYLNTLNEYISSITDDKYLPLTPRLLPGRGGGATMVSRDSLSVAEQAVACVFEATEWAIANGGRVFCVTRPPGHHAGYSGPHERVGGCGFCIFNNVAIALRYYQQEMGLKSAVIDFDVHHGNGTEDCLKRVAGGNCFYGSVHLLELFEDPDDDFFPGTGSFEISTPANGGCWVVNCPLQPLWVEEPPKTKRKKVENELRLRGRAGFKLAFTKYLIPKLVEFSPEILYLSAGFDGAVNDCGNLDILSGKQGLDLLPEDYAEITRLLVNNFPNIPIISVLEGGYGSRKDNFFDRSMLVNCVLEHVKALE